MKVRKKKPAATSSRGSSHSIADRIQSVKDVPVYFKTLLYGRAGTGKTHFIGTAPKPVLVLDFREDGITTIRNTKDAFVLHMDNWDDFESIYWYLLEGDHPYKTVAIDTVTSLQDIAMKQVMGDRKSVSQRMWGEIAGLMKTWIMNYRDLPMHVIYTAQDRLSGGGSDDDDEDYVSDGMLLPEMGPYVIPSVAKILNACVGVIGNTFIREVSKKVKTNKGNEKTKTEVVYSMRIGPHARYATKIRCDGPEESQEPVVPRLLDNPSFDKVKNLALGGE